MGEFMFSGHKVFWADHEKVLKMDGCVGCATVRVNVLNALN